MMSEVGCMMLLLHDKGQVRVIAIAAIFAIFYQGKHHRQWEFSLS